MATVWEQSLESGGVYSNSMASLLSHTHRCQCRGVWQEYGQSLESSWLLPDWLPLPTAARVIQPGVGTANRGIQSLHNIFQAGNSRFEHQCVQFSVNCCLLIQKGGFDELNFCALREWTCVCECAVSFYIILTPSVDLF